MRFELELEDWHLLIEIEKTPSYRPDSKFTHISQGENKDWLAGRLAFHSLTITSKPLDPGHPHPSPLVHYSCGVLLPEDEAEMMEDLEIILEEEGLIDHILHHWQLIEITDGPEWKEPV